MKQKVLYCLLALCWLGSYRTARAQADFRAGYIVRLSGDTVSGQTDYRGGARNAEVCRFRSAAAAEITAYTPAQIRGYGFRGGQQFRSQLLAATDSVQHQYPAPPAPVFMEVLATGPLTLFRTRSKSGADRLFIASAAQPAQRPPAELVAKRPAESQGVTQAYRTIRLYRSVLTELVADCDAARLQIGGLAFTVPALTAFVQRCNACRAPAASASAAVAPPAARPARERVKYGLLLGVETSHLTVGVDGPLVNGHFVSGVRPVLGLSVAIPMHSLSEKLSLHVEALVEQQHYADTYRREAGFNPGAHQQSRLDLTYLRVPLLVRYTYPTGRLRPFVQAGVCYARGLRFDAALQTGYGNSVGVVEYGPAKTMEEAGVPLSNSEIGFAGGVGVRLAAIAGRALSLELRTERSSGITTTMSANNANQRYFALLGYSFSK
jgi:hypothetical protein